MSLQLWWVTYFTFMTHFHFNDALFKGNILKSIHQNISQQSIWNGRKNVFYHFITWHDDFFWSVWMIFILKAVSLYGASSYWNGWWSWTRDHHLTNTNRFLCDNKNSYPMEGLLVKKNGAEISNTWYFFVVLSYQFFWWVHHFFRLILIGTSILAAQLGTFPFQTKSPPTQQLVWYY